MPLQVNFISNTRSKYGLAKDMDILQGAMAHFIGAESVHIRRWDYMTSMPVSAHINVFFEVVNPAWLSYAARNVLVPNQEWFNPNWIPYLPAFHEIWTKTHYATKLFEDVVRAHGVTPCPKISFVGWTSIPRPFGGGRKNFSRVLTVVGKNIHRDISGLRDLAVYHRKLEFNVVGAPGALDAETLALRNVKFHENPSDKILGLLFAECGIYWAPSTTEGFGHAANEARSAGSLLVVPDAPPMNEPELFSREYGWHLEDYYILPGQPVADGLGEAFFADYGRWGIPFDTLLATGLKQKKRMSEAAKAAFASNHAAFLDRIQGAIMALVTSLPSGGFQRLRDIPPADLPSVSLLTPTRNRRHFVTTLAKYCFLMQEYPRERLEWVILDDSDEPWAMDAEDENESAKIVFKHVAPGTFASLGEKRNELARMSTGSILVHMDDDDYYPPKSTLYRVISLLSLPGCACVGSAAFGMYHCARNLSVMNVPPMTLPWTERISEACLAYKREFWQERGFPSDVSIAEGGGFLAGRLAAYADVDSRPILVSLLHGGNTTDRTVPDDLPVNGCCYDWSPDLRMLITAFAGTSSCGDDARPCDGAGESCPPCGGGADAHP